MNQRALAYEASEVTRLLNTAAPHTGIEPVYPALQAGAYPSKLTLYNRLWGERRDSNPLTARITTGCLGHFGFVHHGTGGGNRTRKHQFLKLAARQMAYPGSSFWLRCQDSNLDKLLNRQPCYH